MSVPRFDHIGLVVDDLDAAVGFFTALGYEHDSAFDMSGEFLDRVLGLHGVRTENRMLRTPDGASSVELSRYERAEAAADPSPPNRLGTPHVCIEVADLDRVLGTLRAAGYGTVGEVIEYGGVYRLVYARGPENLIVELAQRIG